MLRKRSPGYKSKLHYGIFFFITVNTPILIAYSTFKRQIDVD